MPFSSTIETVREVDEYLSGGKEREQLNAEAGQVVDAMESALKDANLMDDEGVYKEGSFVIGMTHKQ